MPRVSEWMKKEFKIIFPAVLYFFLAINLFKLTFGWIMHGMGQEFITFPRTVIFSLIIGKIMLVVESLPFLNKFSGRPLIYTTLWKTFIYSSFGILFLYIEKLAPLLIKYKDISIAWGEMLSSIIWPRFISSQVWLVVLFLIFVVSREFVQAVGREKFYKIFFG